jgi:hypothetical protein
VLRHPDFVPVQVLTGAPGARTVTRRAITARLRVPRLPRFLGLSAVRRGKRIVVRWRTSRPLRNASVIVVSSDDRAFTAPFFGVTVQGEGRRRFRVSMEPLLGDRYIQLYLVYEPDATQRRIAVTRIARR